MVASRVGLLGAVLAMSSAFPACGGKGAAVVDGAADLVADLSAGPADAATEQHPDVPAGGGDGAADAPAAPDAPLDASTMSPKEVCLAALTAQCTRHAVCQGADVSACLAAVSGYCPDYYFGPFSNRTVENVQACLPALAAMTCTDIAMGIIPSCLLPGKNGPGQACLYQSQCQTSCSNGLDRCGTCSAVSTAATGQPCGTQAAAACGPTDFCHPTKSVCAPKASIVYAGQGEPCDFDQDPVVGCQGDLVCARPSTATTQGTCQPIPQLGEPCVIAGDITGSRPCAMGLACNAISGSCQPDHLCGTVICDLTSSFCRTSLDPMAGPECVPLAGEGAACDLGTTGVPELRCADGLTCAGATVSAPAGVCAKPGGVGAACDASHFCAAGMQCSSSTGGQCVVFDPNACFADVAGSDGG